MAPVPAPVVSPFRLPGPPDSRDEAAAEALLRLGARALDAALLRLHRAGEPPWAVWMAHRERPDGLEAALDAWAEEAGAGVAAADAPLGRERVRLKDGREVALAVMPLRDGAGAVTGRLWAVDTRPRRWTDRDWEVLADLAACAGSGTERPRDPPATRASRGNGPRAEDDDAVGPPRPGREDAPARGSLAARPGAAAWLEALHAGGPPGPAGSGDEVSTWLRERLMAALYAGHLREDDRLPSIRELARALGVGRYAAADAYRRLEAEGLVTTRERSGIYVAPLAPTPERDWPETARWLVEVLGQAVEHLVKIPQLPGLIGRWTAGSRLRCVCAESCADSRVDLALDLERVFGLDVQAVALPAPSGRPDDLPAALRSADLLVSTSYHAAQLRPVAASTGAPLVVASVHPQTVAAVERHLEAQEELVVVCVDAAFGERLRALRGGVPRDRIRVVLAGDPEAVGALDRTRPVLLTQAARERLGERADFRLVAPLSPSFSPAFARSLLEAVVRLNLHVTP